MGFNIGSVLSGLGIPKLDLGSIGKDILTEGKKLLGEVVKDSFTLSNQPGSTFASSMNLDVGGSHLSLPNPIGALANKLLSGVDGELNKFGVNVDFKKVAQELFHLPTQSGGSVTVPSATSRAASGGLPTSPTAAVASTHYANTTSAPLGLGGGGSGSTSSSGSSVGTGGDSGLLNSITSANTAENSALQQLENLNPNDKNYQAEVAAAQFAMSNAEQGMQMLSQIMEMMHQTASSIIGNIR